MDYSEIIHEEFFDEKSLKELNIQLYSCNKVKYLVLDNFFKENFLNNLYKEVKLNYSIQTWSTEWRMIQLTIWKYSRIFYEFYNSKKLSRALSVIIWEKIKIENHIWKSNATKFFWEILKKMWCFLRKNNIWSSLWWHTDGPVEKTVGSFIIYLNKEWSKWDGWELELWVFQKENIISYKSISPSFNRVVILKTEESISWHRVTEVKNQDRLFFHDQLLKV